MKLHVYLQLTEKITAKTDASSTVLYNHMHLDENELQIQDVFREFFSLNKFSVLKIESTREDSER